MPTPIGRRPSLGPDSARNPRERSWSLDVALPNWISIPPAHLATAKWRRDLVTVLDFITSVDRQLADDPECITPGPPVDITAALDTLLDFSDALPPGHRLVAGLGIPGRWPLPVIVSVSEPDEAPTDLLDAAGARGGLPVELPLVDYLPEELGDGIRVTRFDLDDNAAIWATVSCARRTGETDTLLTWRTMDLELVPLFSPHLEVLLGSVRVGSRHE